MIVADLVRLVSQAIIGVLLISGHATLLEIVASQVVLGARPVLLARIERGCGSGGLRPSSYRRPTR